MRLLPLLLSAVLAAIPVRAEDRGVFGKPIPVSSPIPRITSEDDLRRYLVGSTWSWEPDGKSRSEVTFFADGTVHHNAFLARFTVRSALEVDLELGDHRIAKWKFDSTYTHYQGKDFGGDVPLHGELVSKPPAPVVDTPVAPPAEHPEYEQLIASYDAQEKAVETELQPRLQAARDQYTADLQVLATKLEQAKRTDEAKQVQLELKRFDAHGLDGEPARNTPPAARTPWSNLLHTTAAIQESANARRSSFRTKFGQSLTGLEQTYRTKNDAEGVALVQRARALLSIRRLIEAGAVAATPVVSKNPAWWQDTAREGGYIVGFEGNKGGWFQFTVLGGLKPIFMTMHGLRDGKQRGNARGQRVLAREGYAVGGIIARSGEVVDVIKIIFMRVNPDGLSLNPQDAYMSDWLGNEEDKAKPVELNARGHLIVGVTGGTSDVVDSLGLIYLK